MVRPAIEWRYDKRKVARVYWLTHESNTDAMHLYDSVAEKSGFIQYRKTLA